MPRRWVDITFGLTEGWWKLTDRQLRPDYPLLSRTGWLQLLRESGFTDPVALPGSDGHSTLGQIVALARAPEMAGVARAGAQPADWLLFSDPGGVGEHLAALLRARGERCTMVVPGPCFAPLGGGRWQIDPARPDQFRRLLGAAAPSSGHRLRIAYLWALSAGEAATAFERPPDDELARSCGIVLHLVRALVGEADAPPTELWLVTRNAQQVDDARPPAIDQAPLWGLGRVVALEHPEVWGGLIDLDSDESGPDAAAALLATIDGADGEDQIALRAGRRHVARLAATSVPQAEPVALRSDGAYLISGGLGDLGLTVAHWLAQRGAGHLVLIGRRGLPPRAEWSHCAPDSQAFRQVSAIHAVEELGTHVTVVSADVADRGAMAALFERFGTSLPPLRGIVHAAADWSAAPVQTLSPADLRAMLRPKAAGAWLLHELSLGLDLDLFVLFSSTTSLWGARGLAHYAAANQVLDGLARYRRAAGLPGLSVNWGTWEAMRAASADDRHLYAQVGLKPMQAAQALDVLGRLLAAGEVSQCAVAAVDWGRLKPVYEAKRRRPFLAEIAECPTQQPAPSSAGRRDRSAGLLERLREASPDSRRELVAAHVRAEVARALGLDPTTPIDPRQGLFEMGMDSLMSVELKGRLEASVGKPLPSTLTFNYSNVAALSDYLAIQVLRLEEAPVGPQASARPARLNEDAAMAAPAVPAQPAGTDPSTSLSEDELADLLAARLARLS